MAAPQWRRPESLDSLNSNFDGSPFRSASEGDPAEASGCAFCNAEDESSEVMIGRGLLVLVMLVLCTLSLIWGLISPLILIDAFTDSPMATVLTPTLLDIIRMNWTGGNYPNAITTFTTSIIIPIAQFIGMSIILVDNYFAKGCQFVSYPREGLCNRKHKDKIVDAMCMASSYQAIMMFVPILFATFGTTSVTRIQVGLGFYFYAMYCVLSIVTLQAMEMLKEAPEDLNSLPASPRSGLEPEDPLKSRTDSIYPALPGLQEPRLVSVDLFPVVGLWACWACLALAGTWQPLLELRVILDGLTLQQKTMSLSDVIISMPSTLEGVTVICVVQMLAFILLVFVIPLLYTILLIGAGLVKAFCTDEKASGGRFYGGLVWTAGLLRPWAMTDVFAVAVAVFLFSMQSANLQMTIATGFFPLLNAVYLLFGSGLAIFFIRWFWSRETEDAEALRKGAFMPLSPRMESENGELDSEPPTIFQGVAKYITCTPKLARWIFAWILSCIIMYNMPYQYPMNPFKLGEVNQQLNKTLPAINHLVGNLNKSFGSCGSTPTMPPPQPCTENGVLYSAMDEKKRYTILWVTGLNTLEIQSISVLNMSQTPVPTGPVTQAMVGAPAGQMTQTLPGALTGPVSQTLAGSPDVPMTQSLVGMPTGPSSSDRSTYKLRLDGQFQSLKLFLRIEFCQDYSGINCKVFLDTNSSCCEDNRRFRIEISMQCHEGFLSRVSVTDFQLDDLVIAAKKQTNHVLRKGTITTMDIDLPERNITGQVKRTVESKLSDLLTNTTLLKWGNQELNLEQLLARATKVSEKHNLFQC
jgi:uncharacterized paraquat-inducible protein A